MAKVETFKCDSCPLQRGAADGWYRVFSCKDRPGLYIAEWDNYLPTAQWLEHTTNHKAWVEAHLCGLPCVMKFISRHFQSVPVNT